ncbi:hypothetical protein AMR72_17075 [Flavobacterium psychrophilum]|nr:hypothetical protein AMR72_17075 [Flavobacterium psychrophilum]AOE54067.1 hypothetical protein ALW18_17065 [Flavobacterium psychrophilum]
MAFKKLPLLFTVLLLIISCDHKKEEGLAERERALTVREQEFETKEADYKQLLKMRDSVFALKDIEVQTDTLIAKTWPDSLGVQWSSKMVCRESNCSNYVIGDQRNEVWQFASDSLGVFANVLNNDKLVRVYRTKFTDNKIILDFATDSTAKNKVKMNVVLDDVRKKVIKGMQTITGKDNCTAKFSVELTPSPKK